MTIAKEDVTEFLMIFCIRSTAAIKENTGIGRASVRIHRGEVMIGEPQFVRKTICKDFIILKTSLIDSALCACRGTSVHFHICENSIHNQRRQSFRRLLVFLSIPGGEDHVIGD